MPPKERFSSLCGKAVKKPVVMGFWPHCVALMAASPSLALSWIEGGGRLRETIPFIGDQVLASRAVPIRVLSVEWCY